MSIRQEAQQELSKRNIDERIALLALVALEGQDEIEKVLAGEIAQISEYASDAEEQVSPVYQIFRGFRCVANRSQLSPERKDDALEERLEKYDQI